MTNSKVTFFLNYINYKLAHLVYQLLEESLKILILKKKNFFDTIIFGLTTIPIVGWFKLIPTFGGRVITIANELKLKDNLLQMNLIKTKVSKLEGLNKIPLFSKLLMDRWYPVKEVWIKLPWNKESPSCEVSVIYLDKDIRIMKDIYGSIFVYVRPTISLTI